MTRRLAAAALVAALAACGGNTAPQAGADLREPSAVAWFRGVTLKSPQPDPADPLHGYHPFLAVADAYANDLEIFDAVDDSMVLAPVPLRGLVYPVPGRPQLLASADLGDNLPDLLAVVTAGDLPWLGGSKIQVIRTWSVDGAIEGEVDVGGDILALATLPHVTSGQATLVATLAGERIAVVTFSRAASADPDPKRIDVALTSVSVSDPLGFQPADLAVDPGDPTRVFAASTDPLPPAGVHGVAAITFVGNPPAFSVKALDALAPTRLVAAARLLEANPLAPPAFDDSVFAGQPAVARVYAVLDESGCGLAAPIACGLVALDPDAAGTNALLPDPTEGVMHGPFRAPIPLAGILALGVTGPPQVAPDPAEPQYAGTLRIAEDTGNRQTTAAAGVATPDGWTTFVDLGRWDVPSEVLVGASVKATVTPLRPPDTAGAQWLVLETAAGGDVLHSDAVGLSAAAIVSAGFTPSDHWVVAREGILPNLQLRNAEVGYDAAAVTSTSTGVWLALQQTAADGSGQAAVRLWDPTLGVQAGDIVVIDPTGLGTCGEFEATVADEGVQPPDPTRPGGFVLLKHRDTSSADAPAILPANLAKWNGCLDLLRTTSPTSSGPFFAATFRARDYVLTRGAGAATVHVGRPVLTVQQPSQPVPDPFTVVWKDELALAAACPLPPAVPWDGAWGLTGTPPACDETCRTGPCWQLQQARLARRVGYVVEPGTSPDPTATLPALGFRLTKELPTQPVPRDSALIFDTSDGRAAFRAAATIGSPVQPRGVVPFDRSPWRPHDGVRFFVPFAGGIVVDSTPTLPPLSAYTIH